MAASLSTNMARQQGSAASCLLLPCVMDALRRRMIDTHTGALLFHEVSHHLVHQKHLFSIPATIALASQRKGVTFF
jgi:hypothetical protein